MYRWLAILLLISSCQSAPKASLYPIPHRQRLTCSGDTSQVHVRYVGKEKDYDLVELKTDKATYLFGKEPWQVISSISRRIAFNNHEIRQTVIEGDLNGIMNFPGGKEYSGKISETNPKGTLIRHFHIKVGNPITYESPHYGPLQVIPFEEKMWGDQWSSDLLLYFSREMGTKVYFKYKSSTLKRECHLAESSSNT